MFKGKKKKCMVYSVISMCLLVNFILYIRLSNYMIVENQNAHKDPLGKEFLIEQTSGLDPNAKSGLGLQDSGQLTCEPDIFPRYWCSILSTERTQRSNHTPDMRSDSCKNIKYESLPKASIIIVIQNEDENTCRRTLSSVMEHSPLNLVKEVIIVDDASNTFRTVDLQNELFSLLKKQLSKDKELMHTSLIKNKKKGGLDASRESARQNVATGEAVVFLDCHYEVGEGWLQPLLAGVKEDVIVSPLIDSYVEELSTYIKSKGMPRAAFTWRLQYLWLNSIIQNIDNNKPYPTPVIFEGVFAIYKSLHTSLSIKPCKSHVRGNENMDLALKAWLFGARVQITPCSRIFRIFRRNEPKHVNRNENLARRISAMIWMDEWAEFYGKFHPTKETIMDKECKKYKSYVNWRDSLDFKSFKWYFENVWPQHFFPSAGRWFGRMRNGIGPCIVAGLGDINVQAQGSKCGNDTDLSTMLIHTPQGQIMADEGLCLEHGNGKAFWNRCSESAQQVWSHLDNNMVTSNTECLTFVLSKEAVGDLLVAECKGLKEQVWYLDTVPWS